MATSGTDEVLVSCGQKKVHKLQYNYKSSSILLLSGDDQLQHAEDAVVVKERSFGKGKKRGGGGYWGKGGGRIWGLGGGA